MQIVKRQHLIAFRCDDGYRRWLTEQAKATRRTVAQLIDHSLAELARRDGLRPPPARVAATDAIPEES